MKHKKRILLIIDQKLEEARKGFHCGCCVACNYRTCVGGLLRLWEQLRAEPEEGGK